MKRGLKAKKGFVDKRAIRPTKSYTLLELAEACGKSIYTIHDFVDAGLPTMDDRRPAMVFGYLAINWLRQKEALQTFELGTGQYFCYKCRVARYSKAEEVIVVPHIEGVSRAIGQCAVCGGKLSRTLNDTKSDSFLIAARSHGSSISRFIDSDSRSGTPDLELAEPIASKQKSDKTTRLDKTGMLLPQNPTNERTKRHFLEYEHEALARSKGSCSLDERALLHFENYTKFKTFSPLTVKQAISFKRYLFGKGLSLPVIKSTLAAVHRLFDWLDDEPGFRRSASRRAIGYLRLTNNEHRQIEPLERHIPSPSIEEIDVVVSLMSSKTFMQRRNRGILLLFAMTAPRASALASLRLKHLDVVARILYQPGREVRTKFSKPITSILVVFKESWLELLVQYVDELRQLGFGPDDPLFPKLSPKKGAGAGFGDDEITREFFSDAQQLNNIVPSAFLAANLSRYSTHVFRHVHGKLINNGRISQALEKAISLNLGHKSIATTRNGYATMNLEQREKELRQLPSLLANGADDPAKLNLVPLEALMNELHRRASG